MDNKLLEELNYLGLTVTERETVMFGAYPQSDPTGQMREPIEWYPIGITDYDTVVLLSKYCLRNIAFEDNRPAVSFEDSSLYSWLNGEFSNVLTPEEKKKIIDFSIISASFLAQHYEMGDEILKAVPTKYALTTMLKGTSPDYDMIFENTVESNDFFYWVLNERTDVHSETSAVINKEGKGFTTSINDIWEPLSSWFLVRPTIELPTRKFDEDFEKANKESNTQNSSSGGCYVATAVYGSYDCPEVWTLRRYRDNELAKTWYGRLFIHTYYAISPTIVKWFGKTAWFKNMWRGKLDSMVKKLNESGVDDTPYNDINW